MDSPLDFFRRNQKTLLPVIAIGCMVAFVVLPGLLGLITEKQQQASDRNPVLYKWQGGELRQRELQQELDDHQRLAYLYTRVNLQKVALSMPPSETSQQLMNAYSGVFQQQFQELYPGPSNFENAANFKIYDQLGKELGIVVSDNRIDEFLHELCGVPQRGTDGKPTGKFQTVVPAASFDAIMADMAKTDPGFTQDRLFELLKRAYTRKEVLRLFDFDYTYPSQTPLARWENYRRIRQRASIQAIPVPVSNFVAGVREPNSDELAAFFEASKSRLPDPNSADVGLRLPIRATFQVAYINLERLTSSFKPRIENKAISDYYEKHKVALFTKPKLPTIEPSKTDDTKLDDAANPLTPALKPGETLPGESKPADAGAKDAPKTEPAKSEPAKTEPVKTEPGKTEPAKSEPAKTEPAKTQSETPPQDAPKKQSGLTRDGLLPVNFQADAKKEPASDAAKAADPVAADAKSPAADEPAKSDATKSDATKSDPAKSDFTKLETPKSEPVEYLPLAEVEGKIREILATEKANEQADMLLQKIEDEMTSYRKRRDRALNAAEDASQAKLEEFDFAKVIAGIDPTIETETLALVSRDQFAKHPVSQTTALFTIPNREAGENNRRVLELQNVAHSEKIFPLYEPFRPTAATGRYIIWKTEQRADEVPSLSDPAVREQAIAAWKKVEARKAAEKQAQEYAELARKAIKADTEGKKQTLVELYNAKELPVAPNEIASFSWITLPTQQGDRPTVSKVSGLDSAGNELMKEIFNLKQGQIGVAPNQPKTVYYVVQVTQADDLTKLRESFMQDVRTAQGWQQFAGSNYDQQVSEARSFYERLRQRYKMVRTENQPYRSGNEE